MNWCPRQQQPARRSLAAGPCRLGFQRGCDECLCCIHQPILPSSLLHTPSKQKSRDFKGLEWMGRVARNHSPQGKDHVTRPLHTSVHAPPLTLLPDEWARTHAGVGRRWRFIRLTHETAGFNKSALEGTERSVGENTSRASRCSSGPGRPPPLRLHCDGCHGHCISGTQQQSARVPP